MIVKPSIGFLNDDGDADLVISIKTILFKMTGNASYPKAAALLLLVAAALEEYIQSLVNARDHSQTATSIKKEKREALCTLVRALARDVTDECAGSMSVLLTSGFPIQKPQHNTIGALPTPVAPTLTLGTYTGDLEASTPPIYGSLTFNWTLCYASAPTVVIQEIETSAPYVSFHGTKPGEICVVQVNVVGTAGTSDFSQSSSLMVV